MPGQLCEYVQSNERWGHFVSPVLLDVAQNFGVVDHATRLTAADRAVMKVVTVFPSFVLLTVGDTTNWLSWIPLAADRTDMLAGFLLPPVALEGDLDPADIRHVAQDYLNQINGEDELATARLQRAATSQFATRGYLSATERTLTAFHQYLARALTT